MTDNAQATPAQAQQPPAAPPPVLTEEQQIESIKIFLFQGLMKSYSEMSLQIKRLPIDPNLVRIMIEKLDDVWVWVKESFNVLQISLPKPPQDESKSQAKRKEKQKKKKR